MRNILSNGTGNGMHPYASFLSSLDEAPVSPFHAAGKSEIIMKKQWKESEYSKKLRDPRWQKKRLEILERDHWVCQSCFDGESTLHVHHLCYFHGKNPWEYSNDILKTLCESCHEIEGEEIRNSRDFLHYSLSTWGFLSSDIDRVSRALSNSSPKNPAEVAASILAFAITNEECREAIENLFWEDTNRRVEEIKKKENPDG